MPTITEIAIDDEHKAISIVVDGITTVATEFIANVIHPELSTIKDSEKWTTTPLASLEEVYS